MITFNSQQSINTLLTQIPIMSQLGKDEYTREQEYRKKHDEALSKRYKEVTGYKKEAMESYSNVISEEKHLTSDNYKEIIDAKERLDKTFNAAETYADILHNISEERFQNEPNPKNFEQLKKDQSEIENIDKAKKFYNQLTDMAVSHSDVRRPRFQTKGLSKIKANTQFKNYLGQLTDKELNLW